MTNRIIAIIIIEMMFVTIENIEEMTEGIAETAEITETLGIETGTIEDGNMTEIVIVIVIAVEIAEIVVEAVIGNEVVVVVVIGGGAAEAAHVTGREGPDTHDRDHDLRRKANPSSTIKSKTASFLSHASTT